ncbi:DoxX family protein [Candidatus Microgenomates bacterium]|nr:DoxX family protein [Candidatus Microgenomates bacterium]
MSRKQQLSLLFLRLALGWIFLYSGVTKILDPGWSAAGYLKSSQTLPFLYNWFASTANIGWINFSNEWGQALIGAALILGVFVRPAAVGGIVMMVLYYLPILHFPYVGKGTSSFLVDQHVIFILVFVLLIVSDAGKYWSLESIFKKILRTSSH